MLVSTFIPKINNTKYAINPDYNRYSVSAPAVKYSNLAPLSKDTVSFGATKKNIEEGDVGVNFETAEKIHSDAKESALFLEITLNDIFGDMIRGKSLAKIHERPIEKISCRIKSTESICDKSAGRRWYNEKEVKRHMTDIVGARIVMADSSTKQVDRVINRLTEAVRDNKLKILEIENYRPDPILNQNGKVLKSYDYSSRLALKNLKDVCDSKGKFINKKDEDLRSGYMAIHLLVQLPNGFTGEIQIMGSDVEKFKEVEDICYKVKNGKKVDKKYDSVVELLKPVADAGEDDPLSLAFEKYTRKAYIYQRVKEPNHGKYRKESFFEIPEDLKFIPKQLDFNNIAKEIKRCNGTKESLKSKDK